MNKNVAVAAIAVSIAVAGIGSGLALKHAAPPMLAPAPVFVDESFEYKHAAMMRAIDDDIAKGVISGGQIRQRQAQAAAEEYLHDHPEKAPSP